MPPLNVIAHKASVSSVEKVRLVRNCEISAKFCMDGAIRCRKDNRAGEGSQIKRIRNPASVSGFVCAVDCASRFRRHPYQQCSADS